MNKLLILFTTLLVTASSAADKPNVVLILSDDQSWTDYSFMGHPAIQTPHLDKLASQSATFHRGYVPTALCRPSLVTLITGQYSHQNMVTGNNPARTPENRKYAAAAGKDARELLISNIDKRPTVPRLLAKQGYLSFQCGKWWEGSYQRGGFSHGMTRGYPEKGGRHGDDGLKIGREGMKPVNVFIDMAVDEKKPFFLWYAPFLPHTPHNPPQRLLDKYTKAGRPKPVATYYAMCDWFDETCGQLLDKLDEKGIADNTIVIYVTDNGWIQSPDSGGYEPRSKRSPYEGGTRTPIMFRWPKNIKPAERPELCSSIDIVPTILAATGSEIPKELPGLNLLPNLREGTAIQRDHIFGESFAHDIADIQNPRASLLFRWVIRGSHKLLLSYDGAPGKMKYPPTDKGPQLYDLKSDPHEKTNLASKHPELVKELSDLLTDWYPTSQENSESAVKTIDPSQSDWYEKYKKQKNAPKPESMLVNEDKEPGLDAGFIDLFNGKDLSGWTPKGGKAKFEVKNGVIVGTVVPDTPSTYLCTDKSDYTDFIFTCELKWEVNLNSGVMFRAATRDKKGNLEIFGPQAEMEGIEGDRGWSGGVYGQSCGGYFYPLWLKEHRSARQAIKNDDWNRLTIHAKGNVVKTWVNGVPAAHWVDDGTYSKGFFGLQVHKAKAGKVLFRDLRIKELAEVAREAEDHGFVPIFDGKTLDGWNGDPVYWRVEAGCLVGEITPKTLVKRNTFITWQKAQPADFELKLEYRITENGNSGINYRSEKMDDHPFALTGYQADIDGKNRYTGQNYEERGRTTLAYAGQKTLIPSLEKPPSADGLKKLIEKNAWTPAVVVESLGQKESIVKHIKSEDWNRVRIVARGNRLQHYVNGVLMSDVTDEDTLHRRSSGSIGVQVHVGPPMKVEYRNIMLKNLRGD